MLMVFNAETLAWPIRSFRYIISRSAREKMGKTPNRFPVTWEKTLDHIKDAEENDILHDHEMPKWPRSKLIYLFFLVVYFFIDFPASRIVLAIESVIDADTNFSDHATIVVVRIVVALTLLPIFVASSTILVIWSLLCWALIKIWTFPLKKWKKVQERGIEKHYDQLKSQYQEEEAEAEAKAEAAAKETAKEQEKGKDGDWESTHSVPRGAKNNKKVKPKTVEERIDETLKRERQAKEDRIRQHVTLLINPPELYQRMEPKLRRHRRMEDPDAVVKYDIV